MMTTIKFSTRTPRKSAAHKSDGCTRVRHETDLTEMEKTEQMDKTKMDLTDEMDLAEMGKTEMDFTQMGKTNKTEMDLTKMGKTNETEGHATFGAACETETEDSTDQTIGSMSRGMLNLEWEHAARVCERTADDSASKKVDAVMEMDEVVRALQLMTQEQYLAVIANTMLAHELNLEFGLIVD